MLDEGDDPVRHEPPGSDGRSAPCDLRDLDDPASGRDLEPAAVAGRDDVERLHAALSRVDHDLDPIASHSRTILHGTDQAR
jgi:hypothetical protein